MQIHDLIGVGFGPSNIALAIALDEKRHHGQSVDALFIEKQRGFVWHKNMLLDNAHMQISFIKDLATLRNPASRFTFLNYLHEKQRLQDFVNLKTFFPSRHDFNDYLGWAAAQFEDRCAYGEAVFEVVPEMRGTEVHLLRQRVAGVARHSFLRRHAVSAVRGTADGIHLSLHDLNTDQRGSQAYDVVILATGDKRDGHKSLLDPIAPYVGDFTVDRPYRLQAAPELKPGIFLQGACEMSHGLSDTLLSVTAIRSYEIGQALLNANPRPASQPAQTAERAPSAAAVL